MAEDPGLSRKVQLIKTASVIALGGNFVLAALKIGVGISANSLAVVGDGIDSSVDVLLALMSLVVARIIARPADSGHPWGHGRAETVATVLLALTLFLAGAQLILNSAENLILGAGNEIPSGAALVVTVVSILGKLILAWSQSYIGKKANSAMLLANAKNMASDVIISLAVLAGLILSISLGIGLIDHVAAIIVGIWVIKSAVGIFIEVNAELMDSGASAASYQAVFDAVRSIEGAGNPHRVRMRRIAGLWDVDLDIEVDPALTVRKAHWIAAQVERAIKDRIERVYDIMVHVEPSGGSEEDEGFGLREEALGPGPVRD
ncbi:MAG: cation diffusion facilitator family transporter [Treponema sp.]|jgi:cation diffusion facilitator family transporter|nr:cation diffusion facilitator family transporter [Treponema sp.]